MKEFNGFKSEEEYKRVIELVEKAGLGEDDNYHICFGRVENALRLNFADDPNDDPFKNLSFPVKNEQYHYSLTFLPNCTYYLRIIPVNQNQNSPYYVDMTNEYHLICVVHQLIEQFYNKEFNFLFEGVED